LQNCFPENLKTFPKFRVPKQHAQQHVFENSFDLPFFAFQVPLKWIDEAQIITATIDRKKVQVHENSSKKNRRIATLRLRAKKRLSDWLAKHFFCKGGARRLNQSSDSMQLP